MRGAKRGLKVSVSASSVGGCLFAVVVDRVGGSLWEWGNGGFWYVKRKRYLLCGLSLFLLLLLLLSVVVELKKKFSFCNRRCFFLFRRKVVR